ncbi:WRKY domain-containing protein [Psidium guajava]|nr:WRKY domain-containing protein [Psidium guajava]
MCSLSEQDQIMDNYHQGDLTDIVRASSGGGMVGDPTVATNTWQFPSTENAESFSSAMDNSSNPHSFGDPFSNVRDPFFHDINMPNSCFLKPAEIVSPSFEGAADFSGSTGVMYAAPPIEDDLKRPCNIFTRMLQITPNKLPISPCDSPVMAASPPGIKNPGIVPSDMISLSGSKGYLVDNSVMQISSPRNPGIKRRKSQAKKVVCIPAPAAANSRAGGEVVPSDLWAWRKYGQKPIKGSPYPRGYYRCSSSKGCPARKQVERSRTDPNMLVITYTSEHNHPWPTQRNALAGSTRSSQPSKNNNVTSKNSPTSQTQKHINPKEEQKENINDSTGPMELPGEPVAEATAGASIKEENEDKMDRQLEFDDGEFGDGLGHGYRPSMLDINQTDDFFADLGELEADPLDMLFNQGFSGDDGHEKGDKALDPFSLLDWSDDNNNNTSFNNGKRGL